MDERLIGYIKRNVERGHDIEKIKQVLINAGHDIRVVEGHAAHVLRLKKKNTKYISIALVFLAILILVIGGYYLIGYYKKPKITAVNQIQSAELQQQKNLADFNNALISNDQSLCNNINDERLREECQRRFLSNISNEAIEINESLVVKESKELLNKALINHNTSICTEIKDDTIKNQCEQILTR